MIKHYSLYLFTGLFICVSSTFIGALSETPIDFLATISLLCAFTLFLVAPGTILFYPKAGAIIGLISLVGCSLATYYVLTELLHAGGFYIVIEIVLTILIVVSIIYSLKVILNWGRPYDLTVLSKPLKFGYAALPLMILLICILIIVLIVP